MKIIKSTPKHKITNPSSYEVICQKRNLANFKKASEISGNRSYILKNELVFLEQAILSYVLKKIQKKDFTVITAPAFINEEALIAAGYFPKQKEDHFRVDDTRHLSITSESFINSLHSKEIIDAKLLPLKYCAISKCFRTESDNHSKGSKGLIRVHEFTKIEQFIICKNSKKESIERHHFLLQIAEEIVNDLELPYQIVEFGEEKGEGKILMHDIQVWFPSESRYRETHSCSTYCDWQAKRSNLKFSTENRIEFCHTGNCTAIASPRILAAVIENHQDPVNGRIKIPKKIRGAFDNKEWI